MHISEIVTPVGLLLLTVLLIWSKHQSSKKQNARNFLKRQPVPANPEDDPQIRDAHLEQMLVSIYVARQQEDFEIEQLPPAVIEIMKNGKEKRSVFRASPDAVDFDDRRLLGHSARSVNGRKSPLQEE